MKSELDKHHSVSAASERLGWKEATLRHKILRREIGYLKIGRLVRIPESEIRRLLEDAYRPPLGAGR